MAELKTSRFMFSAEPSLLERVDKWRAKQPGLPSRAEAVRRLIVKSLGTD
jgi:metal-responsive CopG/Arc/MetJ family transcriptional regulator